MENYKKIITHERLFVVPILVLLIFVGFYVTAQLLVIECRQDFVVGCEPIRVQERLLGIPEEIPPVAPKKNNTVPANLAHIQKRYSGRMLWVFVASAYVLSCISVICIFWCIAATWLKSGKRATVLILLGLAIGIPFTFIDTVPLARPLFANTIENHWAGLSNFFYIIRLIGGLAYGTSVSMVLVVAAILFGPRTSKNDDGTDSPKTAGEENTEAIQPDVSQEEKILARKRNHLTIVLYASTVILVIGIVLWDQNFTWAVSFIEDEPAALQTKNFFTSVIATLGGFFTLLLAAIYLPASFIIYEQAKLAVEKRGVKWQEVPAELEKLGFTFSFTQSLPRILAIAAPLLTGPVSELFKNVKFG